MKVSTLYMVGGFLGAGKTTLMAKAAEILRARGIRVGLVTNDQAADMVDTRYLELPGNDVREVSGSCFCCNFPGFLAAADSLRENDCAAILAESVGSCTDLSATILQPLKDKHTDRFILRPFSVVLDPCRITEIFPDLAPGCCKCLCEHGTHLHPSAAYILRRQMDEADILLLNKIDVLKDEERARYRELLAAQFPKATIMEICAATGEGVAEWLAAASVMHGVGTHLAEVDYDTYAEGEAVLGWLNASLTLSSDGETSWMAVAEAYMAKLAELFEAEKSDTGHLKILLSAPSGAIRSNLIRTGAKAAAGGDIPSSEKSVHMLVNARVAMSPEHLESLVRKSLDDVCGRFALKAEIQGLKSLMPGRPSPTYRYREVISLQRMA